MNDLAAEVAELRSRGVEVEEYDEPGLKTVDGIADVGFALGRLARRPARKLDRAAAVQGRELTGDEPPTGGPVTTTVTRRVKPGHEALLRAVPRGASSPRRARFPGHLGVEVFRPQSATAGEYRTVYRFDTAEHLRAWLDSDEHAAWLERAEPHVIGPMRTSFVTGLETWFTLPGRPGAPPPPPYKMALLTWITIFPLITAIVARHGSAARGPAAGRETGDHDRARGPADDVGGDAARDPAAAPMAVSRTPRYGGPPVTTEPDKPTPSLYEWAGGEPAIRRLMDCFYDRVERDDLLSPASISVGPIGAAGPVPGRMVAY